MPERQSDSRLEEGDGVGFFVTKKIAAYGYRRNYI